MKQHTLAIFSPSFWFNNPTATTRRDHNIAQHIRSFQPLLYTTCTPLKNHHHLEFEWTTSSSPHLFPSLMCLIRVSIERDDKSLFLSHCWCLSFFRELKKWRNRDRRAEFSYSYQVLVFYATDFVFLLCFFFIYLLELRFTFWFYWFGLDNLDEVLFNESLQRQDLFLSICFWYKKSKINNGKRSLNLEYCIVSTRKQIIIYQIWSIKPYN